MKRFAIIAPFSQTLKLLSKSVSKIKMALIFSLLFSLTSCIEISEIINLNKDGSGDMKFVLDASKMIEMLKGMDTGGEKTEGLGKGKFKEMFSNTIGDVDGISAYKVDEKDGVTTMTFKFKSIKALNEAMNVMHKKNDFEYFSKKDKLFTRNIIANQDFGSLLGGDSKPEDKTDGENGDQLMDKEGSTKKDNEQMQAMKMFFTDAHYTTIYNFKQKVKESSNEKSEISKNSKSVTVKIGLLEIMDKKADISTAIKLK